MRAILPPVITFQIRHLKHPDTINHRELSVVYVDNEKYSQTRFVRFLRFAEADRLPILPGMSYRPYSVRVVWWYGPVHFSHFNLYRSEKRMRGCDLENPTRRASVVEKRLTFCPLISYTWSASSFADGIQSCEASKAPPRSRLEATATRSNPLSVSLCISDRTNIGEIAANKPTSIRRCKSQLQVGGKHALMDTLIEIAETGRCSRLKPTALGFFIRFVNSTECHFTLSSLGASWFQSKTPEDRKRFVKDARFD